MKGNLLPVLVAGTFIVGVLWAATVMGGRLIWIPPLLAHAVVYRLCSFPGR